MVAEVPRCCAVAPERRATLRTRSLTKTYRTGEVEVAALRGVDLALYEGAPVVLLGASRADAPTSGEVWFGEELLSRFDHAAGERQNARPDA